MGKFLKLIFWVYIDIDMIKTCLRHKWYTSHLASNIQLLSYLPDTLITLNYILLSCLYHTF